MCGRYALEADIDLLIERYKAIMMEKQFETQAEIFPTNKQPIVINENKREIITANWGFMPSYAKRPLINARGETVYEKPTFKRAFYNSRCLIPATSFFEWEEVEGKKIKRKISMPYQEIFSMAGIYSMFTDKSGTPYQAYTIITTEANEQMKKIHNRMPVIITLENEDIWLNSEEKNISRVMELIKPLPLYINIE